MLRREKYFGSPCYGRGHTVSDEQNCFQVNKMSFKQLLRSQISESFSCSNIITPRRRARRVVDLKVPNFKTGDADTFTNYRPISILSSFSKIYERVLYNRLAEFIDKFKILHKFQFGFRSNHSINFAFATAIDRKEMTAGVFLDLSKAFDTLNHDILFSKLVSC